MITIVKSPLARTAASPYCIDDAGLISTGDSVEPGTMVTINPRITVKSAPGAGASVPPWFGRIPASPGLPRGNQIVVGAA